MRNWILLLLLSPVSVFAEDIWQAAETGNSEKISYYALLGTDMNQMDENGLCPLAYAVLSNRYSAAETLLENGASPDVLVDSSHTLLHIAAANDSTKMMKLLVENGAETAYLNLQDENGQTALHAAARDGFFEVAALLIELGANVNAADDWGDTPLHLASSSGEFEIVELLLTNSAIVDFVDSKGDTPLFEAIRSENLEIVSTLVSMGADVNFENNCGYSPLEIAIQKNNAAIAEYLFYRMDQ